MRPSSLSVLGSGGEAGLPTEVERLLCEVVADGFVVYCCGPRAAPFALVAAYQWEDYVDRRCCVVAWWARLGAAVHSSDGEDEFGEGLRDPMSWFDVGGQFVMTAVEILDEGVSRADYSR